MNVLNRLKIDDLRLALEQTSLAGLSLAQLQHWAAQLKVEDELLDRQISFCDQSYQRKLLYRTPQFDLLLLCWKPGQCSTIHDHADSLNVTRVYRGVLTSRLFAPVDRPLDARCCCSSSAPLQLQQEEQLHPGDAVGVDRYQIHQLANTSTQNLVTLHIYARPLQNIQVYSPDSGQIERVPICYDVAAA